MANTLEIVKGPHVLFTGTNGKRTSGITVRSTLPASEVEAKGYQRCFNVNDFSIARFGHSACDFLGITAEELAKLKADVAELSDFTGKAG